MAVFFHFTITFKETPNKKGKNTFETVRAAMLP
jgi:hypothetical protein